MMKAKPPKTLDPPWCVTCEGYRSALIDCGRDECPHPSVPAPAREECPPELIDALRKRAEDFGCFGDSKDEVCVYGHKLLSEWCDYCLIGEASKRLEQRAATARVHTEATETLTEELRLATAMNDVLTRSKSPCGHWGCYAVSEDGGKHIDCLKCEVQRQAEATERLRALVTTWRQREAEYRKTRDGLRQLASVGFSRGVRSAYVICADELEAALAAVAVVVKFRFP